jgi:hypothetical protein
MKEKDLQGQVFPSGNAHENYHDFVDSTWELCSAKPHKA